MNHEPKLGMEIHQNRYLAEGHRRMDVIARVTSSGGGKPRAADTAEVLLIDCSTSMRDPATKIAEARRAAIATLDALPDGINFAVVRGTDQASTVYPPADGLAVASDQSREEARRAVRHLDAMGGTTIGSWLAKARELFDGGSARLRHAILLTDGRNEHQTRRDLRDELDRCEGRFVCDARGIGDGWEPDELALIVSALRGSADSALHEGELAVDFLTLTESALGKLLPDVCLQIGTMPYSTLRFVKQVRPNEYDLTDRLRRADERVMELSLGSMSGDESRDYHLCFDLTETAEPSYREDVQVGWVDLAPITGARVPDAPSAVLGRWTSNPAVATLVDPMVERYTVQEDLGRALTTGGEAYDRGDQEAARERWGQAVKIATEMGNDTVLDRLKAVVDVVNAKTGEVRLRKEITASQLLHVAVSTVSRLSPPTDEPPRETEPAPRDESPGDGQALRYCGHNGCAARSPADARYCEGCSREFPQGTP